MTIWVDAQLSPVIASWLSQGYDVHALALRDIGLRDATDLEIFLAARAAGVAVMTKDVDFVLLLERFGPPPQILWMSCGNTSNLRMKEILSRTMVETIKLLESGEKLVEIRGTDS